MDPYRDIAEYYDCEHADIHADVEFYLNVLVEGPVLEIGAGTGRVAASLARAGLETWGVDPSTEMLDRARRNNPGLLDLHYVQTGAENLDLDRRFAAALIPLNGLWHLPHIERQLCALHTVRRHMLPGGLLVIDLSNPYTMADRGAAGEIRQAFRGECHGLTVTRLSAAWDDEADQILQLALTYEVDETGDRFRRVTANLTLRYLYRWEAELLVRLAGFRVRQVYGSYDLDPYTAESDRIILVAQVE